MNLVASYFPAQYRALMRQQSSNSHKFKLHTKQQKKFEIRRCAAAKKKRKNLNMPKHKKPCDLVTILVCIPRRVMLELKQDMFVER